ncbi:MAG: heavy metal translocating P-type ATPase [Deltaproteobacteria bacterium]|jgi:Cu2+-exporting ATPase|nr:heavy metal translocating P-type ATPase [Deltaproteobacteria bacterium]
MEQACYYIAHSGPGRIRLRPSRLPTDLTGEKLREMLASLPDKIRVEHARHSGSILVFLPPEALSRSGSRTEKKIKNPIPGKLTSYLLPFRTRALLALFHSLPYFRRGLRALFIRRRLDLDVLDATALAVCLLQGDFRSFGSIVFFFALGEYLADWTRKKSHAGLAESLALNIDSVWIKSGSDEIQIPLKKVSAGDLVIVRAGTVIPVDGRIASGEALVNLSSMTGEPLPIRRGPGQSVFAGAVVEEGEIRVETVKTGGDARIYSILRGIEDSEAAKASIQTRYEHIADGIVPYNFLLSLLIFIFTGTPRKAGAVLLVDYSCALRLAAPLAVLTGLREAAGQGVLIKGGKFIEALAGADTVVFDKTGTLTEAQPTVVEVIPFNGYQRDYILKSAACLEEHFPHPVGRAVVAAAEKEKLSHTEEHAEVELIVAHGIASRLHGQRVLLGSEHFLREDSRIRISEEQNVIINRQAALGRSILYISFDSELAGIILIEDKIRPRTAAVVEALRADGIKRVLMLTGDGEPTAAGIATAAGITEYQARLLPEQKSAFIRELRAQGHSVLMLGDGVNDSPALSAAQVGVSMNSGADITKEVADVVLTRGRLEDLLTARAVSRGVLTRIRRSFRYSLFLNSLFLAAGLSGLIGPGIAALLHNATTAAIALGCMRRILPHKDES